MNLKCLFYKKSLSLLGHKKMNVIMNIQKLLVKVKRINLNNIYVCCTLIFFKKNAQLKNYFPEFRNNYSLKLKLPSCFFASCHS